MNTKRITIRTAGAALCLGMLLSCGLGLAQDVRYNSVPGTDFSKYKTYKWNDVPNAQHPDQILDTQIRQAIDSQLVAKGLTKAAGDSADLYIDYQVAVNEERQWNTMGAGPGWRWGGMGTATSTTIRVGTLVVDIYDVAAKQQIWRGTATKTLNPSKNQQKNLDNLNKAVAKLMKNYPPPVKK